MSKLTKRQAGHAANIICDYYVKLCDKERTPERQESINKVRQLIESLQNFEPNN